MKGSKWITTVASIWIQATCGASYVFGIYSSALKSSQGYDQSTLDTVSVFKDIGANVGVLSGLLYDAVAAPWAVILAGAIQCFAGYFLMWLSVAGIIERPHVLLMCFFVFMATHAQTFFSTANVVVGVRNFPEYSGTIVGIIKGFLGLSSAILIQIYQTVIPDDPTTFLLLLALFPTFVSMLLMCFVDINPSNTLNDKKHLNGFSLLALVVSAYLMIIIIFKNIFVFPLWVHLMTLIVLLLLMSSPIQIAVSAQRAESHGPSSLTLHVETDQKSLDAPLIDSCQEEVEMNLLEAMCTAKFWLLFLAMICGMGTGLATINNMSQIGESLDYSLVEINTLVSLWSIWNFLGRFGGGYVSDVFLHQQGWGRPLFVAMTQATMTVGHLIIASAFPGNLYVGSVVVGICYGCQWSLMPTITSEIFGVKHMGMIFNAIAAANPVGSYIFSVHVIGRIYDKRTLGGENTCYGAHCFRLSFFIFAGVSLFGFFVSLVLFLRTRRFYGLILRKRLVRFAGE